MKVEKFAENEDYKADKHDPKSSHLIGFICNLKKNEFDIWSTDKFLSLINENGSTFA